MVPEEKGSCDNRVLDGEEDLLAVCVTPTFIAGDKGGEACKVEFPLVTGEAMNSQLHTVYYNDTDYIGADNEVYSKENDNKCSFEFVNLIVFYVTMHTYTL